MSSTYSGGGRSFLDYTQHVTDDVNMAIKRVLANKEYDPGSVPSWVDQITNEIMDKLTERADSFKYVVSIMILEKRNGGCHLFSTCFWDQDQDGTITVRWDNKHMHCITSVFGISA